jgi:hypothetical protein
MKMNFDDKIYMAIAFITSTLVQSGDLKTLIAFDLPAWTAEFASSLLSNPPRFFNSSRASTQNTGRPERS